MCLFLLPSPTTFLSLQMASEEATVGNVIYLFHDIENSRTRIIALEEELETRACFTDVLRKRSAEITQVG
jgi:hypothetical protein